MDDPLEDSASNRSTPFFSPAGSHVSDSPTPPALLRPPRNAAPASSLKTKVAAMLAANGDAHWACLLNKPGPLSLIDLPVDVLRLIMEEVTHTNDLCSVALSCSALHAIAVPYLYCRFDIVWPEPNIAPETRSGVDALTHGLATLVMGDRTPPPQKPHVCDHCGHKSPSAVVQPPRKKVRRGNHYASYTKKFSLGNGPSDAVRDYHIACEGGKMLGTLAALAISRMRNLETFSWDMPSGIVRDVWLALSSLEDDRLPHDLCRLTSVWVRFHDNHPPPEPEDDDSSNPPPPAAGLPPNGTTVPTMRPPIQLRTVHTSAPEDVESPTFSALPPVRSLTALDMDELAYLDELADLISRSRDKLEVLRIGMARVLNVPEWSASWQHLPSPTGLKRRDGILGCICAQLAPPSHSELKGPITSHPTADHVVGEGGAVAAPKFVVPRFVEDLPRSELPVRHPGYTIMLKLHTLALERVPLSMTPLRDRIDWPRLTHITLLDCDNTQHFWKLLHSKYSVRSKSSAYSSGTSNTSPSYSRHTSGRAKARRSDYLLNLKHIHVNHVTYELICFVRDCLAQNTLEVLFAQDSESNPSDRHIHQVFEKMVMRHRKSLVKLAIDSIPRSISAAGVNAMQTMTAAWKWEFHRFQLTAMFNGDMKQLKELCISINSWDWAYLVQRLHLMSNLRSLYITSIRNHDGHAYDPRALANDVLDAVRLHPKKISLCYLGILDKCFEIQEGDNCDRDSGGVVPVSSDENHDEGDDADDDDDADVTAEDGNDNNAAVDGPTHDEDAEASSEDDGSDLESLSSETAERAEMDDSVRLRTREILFYDDKVAVFKIRHGRL